ncbi:MAG: hypothetical protein SVP26_05515 [Chloroflexota bacterium]|nr:hypothetical protein [Chloroflexota bacterium]
MNLIGQYHVVPMIHPADITTNATATDVIHLANYHHALILIQTGTNSKGCTLTVEKCDDVTPSTHPAIAFNYRKMTTSDTWGALTAAESTGIAIGDGDDNAVIGIEIDCAELDSDYPYVRACLSAPASGNNYYSAVAVLTPRYAQDVPQTAIV